MESRGQCKTEPALLTRVLSLFLSLSELLVQDICVVCPVQFVVCVNTQVFILLHDLNVQTLDVHWCSLMSLPPEINHHLLCLAGVDAQVVQFTPGDKVGDDLPVLQIVPLCHTCNDGCVVGELLEVAVWSLMCRV